MEQLLSDLQAQSILDWIALVTGIIYVYFASKNKSICWFFGIVSCACIAYTSYFNYSLYADAGLNVFYVVMGFVGLYQWKYGSEGDEKEITNMTSREIIIYAIVGLLLTAVTSYTLSEYTAAAATTLDSFTSVFSVIATILLVQRKIENWMLWIVVDVLYVYLYFSRNAILYAVLMVIYSLIAARGWMHWKRLRQ